MAGLPDASSARDGRWDSPGVALTPPPLADPSSSIHWSAAGGSCAEAMNGAGIPRITIPAHKTKADRRTMAHMEPPANAGSPRSREGHKPLQAGDGTVWA